jgi:hypothetical protein
MPRPPHHPIPYNRPKAPKKIATTNPIWLGDELVLPKLPVVVAAGLVETPAEVGVVEVLADEVEVPVEVDVWIVKPPAVSVLATVPTEVVLVLDWSSSSSLRVLLLAELLVPVIVVKALPDVTVAPEKAVALKVQERTRSLTSIIISSGNEIHLSFREGRDTVVVPIICIKVGNTCLASWDFGRGISAWAYAVDVTGIIFIVLSIAGSSQRDNAGADAAALSRDIVVVDVLSDDKARNAGQEGYIDEFHRESWKRRFFNYCSMDIWVRLDGDKMILRINHSFI